MSKEQVTAFLATHNWRLREAGPWFWATHNASLRAVRICRIADMDQETEHSLLQKIS